MNQSDYSNHSQTTTMPAELVPESRDQQLIRFKEIADDLTVSVTEDMEDKLAILTEKYPASSVPTDLTIKENYTFVVEALRELKRPRIDLETNRKEVVKVPNTLTKKINESCKPFAAAFAVLEAPFKAVKKKADDDEIIRKKEKAAKDDEIVTRIAEISSSPSMLMNATSQEIAIEITKLENSGKAQAWAGEFAPKARTVVEKTIGLLNDLYAKNEALEIAERKVEQEKADKLAAEEKARKEETDRLAKQKADQEKVQAGLDAQQKVIEDAAAKIKADQAKIEQDKIEAKEAAQKVLDDAETAKRVAAEKVESDKKAEAKRIADEKEAARKSEEARKNREKNIAAATLDIMGTGVTIDGTIAKSFVNDVIAGKVAHFVWKD